MYIFTWCSKGRKDRKKTLKFEAFGKEKQGGGFKASSILGEDKGAASHQEATVTPVGGKDSTVTKPPQRTERDDILAQQS